MSEPRYWINGEVFEALGKGCMVPADRRSGKTFTLLAFIAKEYDGPVFVAVPYWRYAEHIRRMWAEEFPQLPALRFVTSDEQLRALRGKLYADGDVYVQDWRFSFNIDFRGGVW